MYVIYFDTEFHDNCALIFYKTFSNLLIKIHNLKKCKSKKEKNTQYN